MSDPGPRRRRAGKALGLEWRLRTWRGPTMTALMRAGIFRGPGLVEVSRIPVPTLGERDVLVRVSHCGVCGTDVHRVFGPDTSAVAGSVFGHEWSGTVAAVGPGVSAWALGTPVVGGGRTCGECEFCRAGRPSLCSRFEVPAGPTYGAFAEYIRVGDDSLHHAGNGLDLRAAALTEPLAVALHAVERAAVPAGGRVLVSGAGPIGLLTAAALVPRGATVVVTEPLPRRRELAERLGAEAVSPEELAPVNGPMDLVPDAFDAAIECSGSARAVSQALGQLRPGGRLVLVGVSFEPVPLDLLRILVWEIEVTGSREYGPGGFQEALALLRAGAIRWQDILEEDTDLADLPRLLHDVRDGKVRGKALVVSR